MITLQTRLTKNDTVEVVESDYNDTNTKRLVGKQGVLLKSHTGNLWTLKIGREEHVLHSDELKKI